jgi:hypothetical protein
MGKCNASVNCVVFCLRVENGDLRFWVIRVSQVEILDAGIPILRVLRPVFAYRARTLVKETES